MRPQYNDIKIFQDGRFLKAKKINTVKVLFIRVVKLTQSLLWLNGSKTKNNAVDYKINFRLVGAVH